MSFRAGRDVIVRTERFDEAVRFYETTLGFAVTHRGDALVGFDAGAFTLYVERGEAHGPVFDVRVPDVAKARGALDAAGCAVVEENPSVPRLYYRDPFGLVFNVEQSK